MNQNNASPCSNWRTVSDAIGANAKALLRLAMYIFAAVAITACAVAPPTTRAIEAVNPNYGHRFTSTVDDTNTNSLLVVVSFSGGGSRAAALSYAVLEELSRINIEWQGKRRRLLDEVDAISSVSGGSVTAAYFALFGERIFRDFETEFLSRDFQSKMVWRLMNPYQWIRMTSPRFGRSDVVAEMFDQALFKGATFADIEKRHRRPFVTLNATDMATGHRFEFIQDQFDLLCADLSAFPVARAVAASAAVPLALSPITLKNHANKCQFQVKPWVDTAIAERKVSSRMFYLASKLRAYRDVKARPYVHLLDGGLSDNLGVCSTLDSVFMQDGAWNLTRRLGLTDTLKVVFVVVHASSQSDVSFAMLPGIPGTSAVLASAYGIPMDRYSFETKELLRSSFETWARDMREHRIREGGTSATTDFYLVDVDFDALKDTEQRQYVMRIPSRWHISPEGVRKVREAAATIMMDSPDLNRLLHELNGSRTTSSLGTSP